MSLKQWIAVAVAEKVGVVETMAEFFKNAKPRRPGAGLMKFLRNALDVPPESEDVTRDTVSLFANSFSVDRRRPRQLVRALATTKDQRLTTSDSFPPTAVLSLP